MPSDYKAKPLDLADIRTVSLAGRGAKVEVSKFAHKPQPGQGFAKWLDGLPKLLAGSALRELSHAILQARAARKPVIWGIGGHVVKCGLAPVLLQLQSEGFVTAVAMNGSAAIHDAEIALCGRTSEDVDNVIGDGSFGMAEETALLLADAAASAARQNIGLGEALARTVCARATDQAFRDASLLASAARSHVPITVHVAIGADTPHMSPKLDPAALGAATHHDFRLFAGLVRELEGGGVFLNVGSAVLLPEVFLKAVTVVRNLGHPLRHFFTANLDFQQHYRPLENVVRRPTAAGGKGWAITGHHEIMVPLLAAVLLDAPR